MIQQSINNSASRVRRSGRSTPTAQQPTESPELDEKISLTPDASDAIRAYLAMLAVTSGSDSEETAADHLLEALTAVATAAAV